MTSRDFESAVLDLLANKVISNINVLGASVKLAEFGMRERNSRLIVIVEDQGKGDDGTEKFGHKMTEPGNDGTRELCRLNH